MNVRLKPAQTGAEAIHVDQRMKALGLESDKTGRIDAASAQNIKGGLAAIQAASNDGVLTTDGLAQLRKNQGFVAQMLGRDVPISAKQTRAVKALAMEMTGTASLLDRTAKDIKLDGSLNNAQLLKANERMNDFCEKFNAWSKDGIKLAEVDPKAVEAFAASWAKLAQSAGSYGALLSSVRSEVMSTKGTGFLSNLSISAIQSNLRSGVQGTELLQSLGTMFGGSVSQGRSEISRLSGLSPELVAAFA